MLLFEKRVEGGAYLKDEDWTLPSIVKKIRSSDVFTSLTRRDKYSKELTAAAMKEFFKTNAFYKKDVNYSSSMKKFSLKGWRLVVEGDADE
jgi:hypothetical protein